MLMKLTQVILLTVQNTSFPDLLDACDILHQDTRITSSTRLGESSTSNEMSEISGNTSKNGSSSIRIDRKHLPSPNLFDRFIIDPYNIQRKISTGSCTEYRASIESEVCWPAHATEKGGSWEKHEFGCELTSAARKCRRQTIFESYRKFVRETTLCVR